MKPQGQVLSSSLWPGELTPPHNPPCAPIIPTSMAAQVYKGTATSGHGLTFTLMSPRAEEDFCVPAVPKMSQNWDCTITEEIKGEALL